MTVRALCLAPGDDVAILLTAVAAGERVHLSGGDGHLMSRTEIPRNHKIALRDLPNGALVQRDGLIIGQSTEVIARGSHVHVHNLRSLRARPANEATK